MGSLPPGHRRERPRAAAYGDLVVVATADATCERNVCDALAGLGFRAVVTDGNLVELVRELRPIAALYDLALGSHTVAAVARARLAPLIALGTDDSDELGALAAGADDFVRKPVHAAALTAALRRVREDQ